MNELLRGWARAPLKELAQTASGGTPLRTRDTYFGGDIVWFKSGELNDAVMPIQSEERLSNAGFENSSAKYFPAGAVLIAMYGATVGRLGILQTPATTNQAVCGVISGSALDSKYLFYFIFSERGQLLSKRVGGAQPNINQEIIRELVVPFPPVLEQHRIVAEIEKQFTRLEHTTPQLKSAREKADRLKAVVVRNGFRGDFPTKLLRDVASLKGGLTVNKTRPDLEKCSAVPYLRVANVQRGRLSLGEMKTIMATKEEIAELSLQRGDVLFNEGGDRDKLVRGWVWQGEIPQCIHQNHVFRARLNGEVLPKWVSYFANEIGQSYFRTEGKQTTNLASINITKLGQLPIPVAPVEQQEHIVEQIDAVRSDCEHLVAAIDQAQAHVGRLRQAILAKAFSGQLVAQDPSDQPASALLERIRNERAAIIQKPARRQTLARRKVATQA